MDAMGEKARIQLQLQGFDEENQTGDQTGDQALSICGLRKVYPSRSGAPPKVAVHNLWLGVKKGELLGLLGENGAGKVCTVEMGTKKINYFFISDIQKKKSCFIIASCVWSSL